MFVLHQPALSLCYLVFKLAGLDSAFSCVPCSGICSSIYLLGLMDWTQYCISMGTKAGIWFQAAPEERSWKCPIAHGNISLDPSIGLLSCSIFLFHLDGYWFSFAFLFTYILTTFLYTKFLRLNKTTVGSYISMLWAHSFIK